MHLIKNKLQTKIILLQICFPFLHFLLSSYSFPRICVFASHLFLSFSFFSFLFILSHFPSFFHFSCHSISFFLISSPSSFLLSGTIFQRESRSESCPSVWPSRDWKNNNRNPRCPSIRYYRSICVLTYPNVLLYYCSETKKVKENNKS